ncbi:CUB domain-containing protein-like isoform X2 [Haliotis asinina]
MTWTAMKMMICAFLVTWAIATSASQVLTTDDITNVCDAVSTIGNCSSCNWCSVKTGFPQTVRNLCRCGANECSKKLQGFQCSNITSFFTQNCRSITSWVHQIVCPIAERAASCFVTTATTTTTTSTTSATTTSTTSATTTSTTSATTTSGLTGPEIAPPSFRTACQQRCVRNDLVASLCGGNRLGAACNDLDPPAVNGQYTCCQG